MTRTNTPKTGNTTYHRDGTVTIWNCITRQWERISVLTSELGPTLSREEWARVTSHLDPAEVGYGDIGYKGHAITATDSTCDGDRCYAIEGAVASKDAGRRPFITSIAQAREYITDMMS